MIKTLCGLVCAVVISTSASISPAFGQSTGSSTTPITVHMHGLAFDPQTEKISLGQTVVVVNDDSVAHNVTGSDLGTSGDIAPGKSWKYTFTKEGDYRYTCTYHPGMTGDIVVTGGQ